MGGPSDTSPEAQRVLDAAYRAMTPGRRWQAVDEMYRLARWLHSTGYLSRNPGATPSRVRDDWISRHYGPVPASRERPMSPPGAIRETLDHVIAALDRLGIDYALGGSLASSIYGVSRSTIDADLCVEPFPGKESLLVDSFGPDFYVSRDAVVAAVRDRSSFNIIDTTAGFKVDVFVRKDRPFDRSVLARRRPITSPEPGSRPVFVVSPEDVILLKLEWYRLGHEVSERQWSDLLGVLRIQAGRLDEAYLDRWAADLGVSDLLARARNESAHAPPDVPSLPE
jgi:hypothetical protein